MIPEISAARTGPGVIPPGIRISISDPALKWCTVATSSGSPSRVEIVITEQGAVDLGSSLMKALKDRP